MATSAYKDGLTLGPLSGARTLLSARKVTMKLHLGITGNFQEDQLEVAEQRPGLCQIQ